MASVTQTVEAVTDESGVLVGLNYYIKNLGDFSRVDGKWTAVFADAEEGDPEQIFTSTDIDLAKAEELVKRFDDGEELTEEIIDKEYASENQEEEEL